MVKRIKILIVVSLLAILPTILIWTPFILRLQTFWGIPLPTKGMATIVANYDGPLFLVVAKTLYDPAQIKANYSFPLPTQYYSAHFPLFPLLIKVISPLAGFPYGMLVITVVSAIIALYYFYELARQYFDESSSFWLTFVFSIFPARWLIVRSVGSADPLFVAAIIASVYYFNKKSYLWAGIWGAVAQFTKSPGILLFIAYGGTLIVPFFSDIAHSTLDKIIKKVNIFSLLPLLLIPLSLIGVFYIYKLTYGDFFAYFKSGDNIHLFFPPFQVFNYSQPWVGTFWLEEVIFVYLLAILGVFRLIQKKMYNLAWVAGIYFLTIFFVSHRDILRYALPAIPFILLGYGDVLLKKEVKFVMVFLILPIFLYSLAFISQNVMPISDWGPFL